MEAIRTTKILKSINKTQEQSSFLKLPSFTGYLVPKSIHRWWQHVKPNPRQPQNAWVSSQVVVTGHHAALNQLGFYRYMALQSYSAVTEKKSHPSLAIVVTQHVSPRQKMKAAFEALETRLEETEDANRRGQQRRSPVTSPDITLQGRRGQILPGSPRALSDLSQQPGLEEPWGGHQTQPPAPGLHHGSPSLLRWTVI